MPLAAVVASTLFQKALFDLSFLAFLWLILFARWLARLVQKWKQNRKISRRALVLPACAVIVMLLAPKNSAPTVSFGAEKPALSRSTDAKSDVFDLSPIGRWKPRGIEKNKTATCFWLWEETRGGLMGDAYEVGFAHCPGDSSCKSARFARGESPKFYALAERGLGDDWYVFARWLHH